MKQYIPYLITTVLAPLVGVLAYKLRARVDADAQKARNEADLQAQSDGIVVRARAAALEAQQVPIALLKEELAKRERELAELRTQDREDRGQFIEALTAIKKTMEEIAFDLRSHRDEEQARASDFHKRLDGMDDRMLVIETKLQGGS